MMDMEVDKTRILHLSDLHFNKKNNTNDLAIKIVNDLDANNPIYKVIVTGDIIDGITSNREKSYDLAINFFTKLIEKLNSKFESNVITSDDFIIIPGNHDLERGAEVELGSYKQFLNKFHNIEFVEENYDNEYLSTIRILEKEKIVFIGINSCMIEPEQADISWIENSSALENHVSSANRQDFIKELTEAKQTEWDDFGNISLDQLDKIFIALKKEVNPLEYRILTAFHHHIYPFPETYSKYGDSSMIRNFYDVLNSFSENSVQVILHGHKHVPISRPIATHKYFETPNSMMYVFSTGSSGDKDRRGKCFQVLDLHNKKSSYIAKITKYDYNLEQLITPLSELFIPPKQSTENVTLEILATLEFENKPLFDNYKEIAQKTTAQAYQVDKIISNITNAITQFEDVRNKLKNKPELIYILLLSIHYRIHKQHYSFEKQDNKSEIELIEKKFKDVLKSETLWAMLKEMLSQTKNDPFLSEYKKINDKYSKTDIKEKLGFVTVAAYFTDIFLTLGMFGEIYFEAEGIDHKINIKLPEGKSFKSDLELATLNIESDTERRCAKIIFKCSDPTIHKIAVLIIKDFEDKISNKEITIEEAFKNIGLSIYYIRPSIEKQYGLENLNFEAYIPTLLPLLTGENLYKEREVFIREMIQNCLDAILLRTQIEKARAKGNPNFNKTIHIKFGEEDNVHNKKRKWIKIRDYGVGMDKFKIERYLTSIGRSFYISKDFRKLQEKENISYQPVSNFGIGFLSAFMVCKEISIITKSIESNETLKIEIPNYDGCFFLDKHFDDSFDYGTEIILYQDETKMDAMDFDKIKTYVKETIQDFQLNIEIEDEKKKTEAIEAFAFRNTNKDLPKIFVPFTEEGIKPLTYKEAKKTDNFEYPFGFTVLFNNEFRGEDYIEFNEGIRLSEITSDEILEVRNHNCTLAYNFPSSYIQLDVAREKINSFKVDDKKEFLNPPYFKKNLCKAIIKQAPDLIQEVLNVKENKLFTLDTIFRFCDKIDSKIQSKLIEKIYLLEYNNDTKKIAMVKKADADISNKNKVYIYPKGILNEKYSNVYPAEFPEEFPEEFNHHFENYYQELSHYFNNINNNLDELDRRFENYFQEFNHHFKNLNHHYKKIDLQFKKFIFIQLPEGKNKQSEKIIFDNVFDGFNIPDEKKYFFVNLMRSYQREDVRERKYDAFGLLYMLYISIIQLLRIEEIEPKIPR